MTGHSDWVLNIDYDSSSQLLLSGGLDRRIIKWTLLEGSLQKPVEIKRNKSKGIYALRILPGTSQLLHNGDNNDVVCIDYEGKTIYTYTFHTAIVSEIRLIDISFRPQNTTVIFGSNDGISSVWTVGGVKPIFSFTAGVGSTKCLPLKDNIIFTGDGTGQLTKWEKGQQVNTVKASKSRITAIETTLKKDAFMTAGIDNLINFWNIDDLSLWKTVDLKDKIRVIEFVGSQMLVATGTDIHFYDAARVEQKKTLNLYSDIFAISAVGEDFYATGTEDGKVRLLPLSQDAVKEEKWEENDDYVAEKSAIKYGN